MCQEPSPLTLVTLPLHAVERGVRLAIAAAGSTPVASPLTGRPLRRTRGKRWGRNERPPLG
jgi:hypothetical protein